MAIRGHHSPLRSSGSVLPLSANGLRNLNAFLAKHPAPIEGVSLLAELSFEGLPSPSTDSGTTDSEGYAVFDFDLPAGVKSDGEIKLTGTRNGLSAQVEVGVRVDRTTRMSLSTDKDICGSRFA